MSESRAWLRQAKSDLDSITILRRGGPVMLCQAISKCQQTTEKSVKALVIARGGNVTFSHEVERYMSFLLLRPEMGAERRNLMWAFREFTRGEIRALESLVPKRPAPGFPAARDTEYPFQIPSGLWSAPADIGVFTPAEVDRFFTLASRIWEQCERLVSFVERQPRRAGS